jgi:iron complex outermembrane recepter protein
LRNTLYTTHRWFRDELLPRVKVFVGLKHLTTPGLFVIGCASALNAASNMGGGVASYKNLSLAQLMEIEVTSVSRRPEVLAGAASAVQVVTGKDIARAGARRIPSALRLFSNLQVAQIDSRQWAITARGFNNTTTNKLLVQLDGRILYSPLFAGVFWDVQDTMMEDVDRIEVISGPGATQWGSNAVNGVINITTKSARDTQGGLLTGAIGTELRAFGGVRYGGALAPGLYYRVYAKETHRDSSSFENGADAGDAWHTTQGGFRADWERGSADRLTFQGDTYQGRMGQPGTDDLEVNGTNLLGRWRRALGPKSELAVQSYFDYTHRLIPGSITEHLYIYDFDVQHRLPLGNRQTLIWGTNYRLIDERLRNPSTFGFLPANVKRDWVSGFVQHGLSAIDDRLRLTLGAKVEHNPYTGVEFQPSIRAGWKYRERQLFWGAISRALRTPSRIDREIFAPTTPPFVIAGGPNFESEKLLAYELGYRAEVLRALGVSIATFYHDYDDLRSLEPSVVPGGPSLIANGLEGKSYGAELSIDFRVTDRWRVRAGYTELRVSSRPKPGSGDLTSVRTQALDPNRTALLQSQFDVRENLTFDISSRYVAAILNQSVPAYVGVDVRISWRPVEALELALAGRNLLDRSHPEFGAPATRREVERRVNGSFTWRF